jgi:hypothetical protein
VNGTRPAAQRAIYHPKSFNSEIFQHFERISQTSWMESFTPFNLFCKLVGRNLSFLSNHLSVIDQNTDAQSHLAALFSTSFSISANICAIFGKLAFIFM